MACNGCTLSAGGKPSGCRSNGSCTSGSCNRMNVYDWLSHIPVMDESSASRFIEVSFKNGSRKGFFRNMHKLLIDAHDVVVVENGTGGYDVGVASMTGELARLQMKRKRIPENSNDILNVIRKAGEYDIKKWDDARMQERDALIRARAMARQMKLEMKIGDVEYHGDGRKATFYYTADGRVDFRELIRQFAKEFHVKIDMRQIGARQEAGRVGGIGTCGRELCCSTWLTDFKTVGTAAARYQQLSINQAKLSGQCGRLKCCLNYELDTYIDALQFFPQKIEKIETETGMAYLQKTDIFKKLMWFAYRNSTKQYPLAPERVREMADMNKEGKKPADLGSYAVNLEALKRKAAGKEDGIDEEEIEEVVGTVSMSAISRSSQRKKGKSRNRNKNRGRQQNRK